MTEAQKISDVYRKYWDGMIRKDTDLLRSLMSEDYYLEHMTGVRQSKETFLRELTGGTFNYYSADHDSIEVRIDGDKAIMTGKSRVLAAVFTAEQNTTGVYRAILFSEEKTVTGN